MTSKQEKDIYIACEKPCTLYQIIDKIKKFFTNEKYDAGTQIKAECEITFYIPERIISQSTKTTDND